jgi:hypothetical protein
MKNLPKIFLKYRLPSFLSGICTQQSYSKWLRNRADKIIKRDRNRNKSYVVNMSIRDYAEKIHAAVLSGGQFDPYSGEKMDWKLICKWDTSKNQPDGYKKEFAMMPTVDHVHADILEFEICSWKTNTAKADLEPDVFIALCKKIAKYKK